MKNVYAGLLELKKQEVEADIQAAMGEIRRRYGSAAVFKGKDLLEGATALGIHAAQMSRSEFMPARLWGGPVVHCFAELNDLVEAMKAERILGAALDVIEYEDMSRDGLDLEHLHPAFQYLINSPRTVLTPHVAGWTVESRYKLAKVLADKITEELKY